MTEVSTAPAFIEPVTNAPAEEQGEQQPFLGREIRESLESDLGQHAHVKVVWDKRTGQQRLIVYCLACRSASMVSYHRHEIVALWSDHVGAERHARKAAVAEARAANHEGLFPDPAPAAADVAAPPLGD